MHGGHRGIQRLVFGAAVVAALGFGGTQVAAAPSLGGWVEDRKCHPTGCDRSCRAQGAFSGRCTDAGLCACLF